MMLYSESIVLQQNNYNCHATNQERQVVYVSLRCYNKSRLRIRGERETPNIVVKGLSPCLKCGQFASFPNASVRILGGRVVAFRVQS
jgi:hypothetical protein